MVQQMLNAKPYQCPALTKLVFKLFHWWPSAGEVVWRQVPSSCYYWNRTVLAEITVQPQTVHLKKPGFYLISPLQPDTWGNCICWNKTCSWGFIAVNLVILLSLSPVPWFTEGALKLLSPLVKTLVHPVIKCFKTGENVYSDCLECEKISLFWAN